MIQYNFNRLKGKIKEVCGTQKNFSKMLGIAPNTLSAKLNNQGYFSSNEISKAIEILHIKDPSTAWNIFFTKQVEKNST